MRQRLDGALSCCKWWHILCLDKFGSGVHSLSLYGTWWEHKSSMHVHHLRAWLERTYLARQRQTMRGAKLLHLNTFWHQTIGVGIHCCQTVALCPASHTGSVNPACHQHLCRKFYPFFGLLRCSPATWKTLQQTSGHFINMLKDRPFDSCMLALPRLICCDGCNETIAMTKLSMQGWNHTTWRIGGYRTPTRMR